MPIFIEMAKARMRSLERGRLEQDREAERAQREIQRASMIAALGERGIVRNEDAPSVRTPSMPGIPSMRVFTARKLGDTGYSQDLTKTPDALERAKEQRATQVREQQNRRTMAVIRARVPELRDATDDVLLGYVENPSLMSDLFKQDNVNWQTVEGADGYVQVNPQTGQTRPIQGVRPKPRAEAQGSWSTVQTPEGMVQVHSITGQARPVTMNGRPVIGQQAAGAATEGERKNAGFSLRALDAAPTIDSLGQRVAGFGIVDQGRLNRSPARFQTTEMQLFNQASRQFATAILRKDSGATITDSEEALMNRTYIPQPGDSPQTIARKAQARRVALQELELSGGRSNPPQRAPAGRDWRSDPDIPGNRP